MMSEIEDKVMVKSNNSSNSKQPQRNSNSTEHTEASSHTSSSFLHEEHDNFAVLKELIFDAPDINHARVEHLKKEIAAGTYQITNKKIAMRMLSNFEHR